MAAYLRVSSAGQDPQTQRAAIELAASARGRPVSQWYSDRLTGRTLERPELARLRADARAGRVSELWLYRLDRLTRTGIRDTLGLLEELRGHGVQVVTVADGFDFSGPSADVVIAVLAWAAEMERVATRERLSAARARVEAQGGRWGRPSRLSPLERARLRDAAAAGATVRELAVRFKVPRTTVQRALSRKD